MRTTCLLISPPDLGRPLPRGLLELGSFLHTHGHGAAILPLPHYLDIGIEEFYGSRASLHRDKLRMILRDAIVSTDPMIIGVSNQFTMQYPVCMDILRYCKEIAEDTVTVIGGPHVTYQDLECIQSPWVDIVVRGEGEWTMLELVEAIRNKRDVLNVRGITCKVDGRPVRTPDRPLGNLMDLPAVDFGLLPAEFVRRATVYGMLNRGCMYKCSYCAERIFWRTMRRFPVQRVIDEMKVLQNSFNTHMAALDESTLTLGSKQLSELCSGIIDNGIQLPSDFYVMSRVDTIAQDGMAALKAANITTVWVGIESASEVVRQRMNKIMSMSQILDGCTAMRDAGFRVGSFWIIGHPGDNPKEAEYSLETVRKLFAKDLIHYVDMALFVPYPGTVFFERPREHGVQILSHEWQNWRRHTLHPICQLDEFSANEMLAALREGFRIVRLRQLLDERLKARTSDHSGS